MNVDAMPQQMSAAIKVRSTCTHGCALRRIPIKAVQQVGSLSLLKRAAIWSICTEICGLNGR